jgi:Flp pilus assembly protein CpaB
VSSRSLVLTVRARRALARPLARRLLVAALAAATALTVVSLVDAAATARRRWGRTHPVAVAARDLSPGDVVESGDYEVRELPEAALPPAARAGDAESPLAGAVVRHPILAGEAIVADRLAPGGSTGAAALVPPGARAVAVPLGPAGAPPLAVGDLVDVLAVVPTGAVDLGADDRGGRGGDGGSGGDGGAGGGGEPAFPLVEGATVVDAAEDAVTVAVPGADAPRVAWALSNGAVVLALAGG